MRKTSLFFALALLSAAAFAADSAPIQVVLSGPQVVNAGEPMQVTATLINVSSQPVAIALPGAGGIGYFNYSWKVTDPSGNQPMRKTGFSFPPERDVNDSNFVVLSPGERYQFLPFDPSADLMLAPSASYSIRLTYRYHQDWSTDYLRQHVSKHVLDAIAATPSMEAVSERLTVTVRSYQSIAQRGAQ
jgi:hypothetical protein